MPRKVVASTYVTLDGYYDEPGEWSFPFWSDEAGQFKAQELAQTDALLLGRISYEGFSKAWPNMEEETGDFGRKVNSMPKYVASRTLQNPTWNATVIEGDVAEAVRRLKAEDGGDLAIWGSGQLIDYLTDHDLIDEYRVMLHPFILGSGTKRFLSRAPRRSLHLVDTTSLPNGVLVLTYRPVRSQVSIDEAAAASSQV